MRGTYDFSGWATRNDLRCSDGRVIRKNAFIGNDGGRVPLVWNHEHTSAMNTLGHADLENRDEGVYAYCSFNDSEAGQHAKELVKHGDVEALSIWANGLKQVGPDVLHGTIREVSLVYAGANPGAYIDDVMIHSEDYDDGEALIYANGKTGLELYHAEEKKEEDTMANEKTVGDVFNEMTEEQKTVVYAIVGQALEDAGVDEEDEDEEDDDMKHNVFDDDTQGAYLAHSIDFDAVKNDAKRCGSFREAWMAHSDELMHLRNDGEIVSESHPQGYGIDPNMDYLMPEYRSLNTPPDFIQRDMGWVSKVINGVHHTPFSRIKSVFADITEDEARARGYMKGNLKKYEVFGLLKRTTDPQTIYKKQKLDRDDIIDITDFDVVAWLKREMRMMLDEELARAFLIGDDRLADAEDKIQEAHIRPIWTDDPLYSIKVPVTAVQGEAQGKTLIKTLLRSWKDYKGSGNCLMFTTEDVLTDMLLLEDGMGHFMYPSKSTLATTLRVSDIITVPVMSEITHYRAVTSGGTTKYYKPLAIIVNLNDYNVGADKGGAVSMFDDFDIDYNQQKYLIETRCSGALIKPKSAIVLEEEVSNF